jgi:carbon storage regulator
MKMNNSGLVLTRKLNESIIIGDDIEISVTDIARGKVKIKIQAPDDTVILRKELYDEDEDNE